MSSSSELVLLTLIVLALAGIVRPRAAMCPPGWRQTGVNTVSSPGDPRGSFGCEYFPWGERGSITATPLTFSARIYCSDNEVPVQVDDRIVACRRK